MFRPLRLGNFAGSAWVRIISVISFIRNIGCAEENAREKVRNIHLKVLVL